MTIKTSKTGFAMYVRCGLQHAGTRLFAEHSATCWQCQGCGLAVSAASVKEAQARATPGNYTWITK